MPFKSEKQRRYMWMKHPEIAEQWSKEHPGKQRLPMYKKKKLSKNPGIEHPYPHCPKFI